MRQTLAWAIVLAIVCGAPAMAIEQGAIRGALKMSDGKTAVAGHSITLFDAQTGKPVLKAKTDKAGAYKFSSIPTGRYKVAAAANAYAVVSVPALPKMMEVNLTLPPAVYGQGARRGGGAKTGTVLAAGAGLVGGAIVGGVVGYNSKKGESTRVRVQQVASPSMP